jgi:hypothetical protein
MDKIKIITTLKWAYDLLRETESTDALEDIEDCIVQLRMDKWVGMSNVEIEIYGNQFNGSRLVREIEGLLRERNNG